MITVHKKQNIPQKKNENTSEFGGSNKSGKTLYSNQNQNSTINENEDHLGATSTRNGECPKFPHH